LKENHTDEDARLSRDSDSDRDSPGIGSLLKVVEAMVVLGGRQFFGQRRFVAGTGKIRKNHHACPPRDSLLDELLATLDIPPNVVLQVTLVTPTLSVAVPPKLIESLGVETVPEFGDEIDNEGGIVSADPVWGACRVTVTASETCAD